MTQKRFKILFLGLYNVGKSSFLTKLGNFSDSSAIKGKIKGSSKMEIEIFGFKLDYFDFGGLKSHRDDFLEKEVNYNETDLLFYIVDTQNRREFGDSVDFFDKILKKLEANQVRPKIVVCFHKCDPKLLSDETSFIYENLSFAEKLFKNRSKGWDITFVKSSIYDHSTLIKAFVKGLTNIFEDPSDIINNIFKDFMNKADFDGISLLDHDGLIMFEVYNELPQIREIILTIGLNMAQMSEKLITYNLGFPKSIQIEMNGLTFFTPLQMEDKRYYMTIYSHKIENFKIINKMFPYFTDTILHAMEEVLSLIANK
ncbi:MAG: GTPase domain-containing protein [Candidatus Helarchaeota archaeon]